MFKSSLWKITSKVVSHTNWIIKINPSIVITLPTFKSESCSAGRSKVSRHSNFDSVISIKVVQQVLIAKEKQLNRLGK
ncbi:MAG: hypothetical protein ACTS7D_00815 [Candidatus Hodgkinia cicadicola]